MRELSIDIETFSKTDLTKHGVYRYAEDEDFEILLFGYSLDGAPREVVDLYSGEELPGHILHAMVDPNARKKAWNANFERVCIEVGLNIPCPADQWECTMVKAAMLGLPLSLDAAAKVLKLTKGKDPEGKKLLRFFSLPANPTKAEPAKTRNLPEHYPEKWKAYIEYCRQDVAVEQEIGAKISFFTVSDRERELWALDQKINDEGVLIDLDLVRNAIAMDDAYKGRLTEQMQRITGLANPNSPTKLKAWVEAEAGVLLDSFDKEQVSLLLKTVEDGPAKEVLLLRQELSKTSTAKYSAMLRYVCRDGRIRGLFQLYGANRTGRYAGRGVQVQNLPQNLLPDIDLARDTVLSGDLESLELLFGNVPMVLSQLIRTAFISAPGNKFVPDDFSAIEARVLAWLAGEAWRLEAFAKGEDIYIASASKMFGIPMSEIPKSSPYRKKGKVSELACGYQGSVNALIKMGALTSGLTEEELPALISAWRGANKNIVSFWYKAGNAAIACVETGQPQYLSHGLVFTLERNILFLRLPSGRRLAYLRPRLDEGKYGPMLTYEGMDQTTKQWVRMPTYGGKIVENICQSVSRDCLTEAMLRLDKAGYDIRLHIHDEIVPEVPEDADVLKHISDIMAEPLSWAPGLRLPAEGFETKFYKKD